MEDTVDTLYMFRNKIPFLREIPDPIYFSLDPGEFLIPDSMVAMAREHLEKALKCFVMTYNADIFLQTIPLKNHLCATIKSASLTKQKRVLLRSYEQKFRAKHVSFVAYQKPLKIISPTESPLYPFYQTRKLPLA